MTYEELVNAAREAYCTKDASSINEHVAIQFNVTGEASGIFYLEIKDGKAYVEPYEYFDRDAIVTATAEDLIKMAEGKLDMEAAYFTGKIKAEGNLGKALLLKQLTPKAQAKKEAKAKKAEAKVATKIAKTAAKSAEKNAKATKKTVTKAVAEAPKAEAKATPAAKKTTTKTATKAATKTVAKATATAPKAEAKPATAAKTTKKSTKKA